jgi:predicted dehydrogenase
MDTMHFGLIGTNFITDWFLEQALLRNEFTLEAVYSRSMEKARSFAECYGAKKHMIRLATCIRIKKSTRFILPVRIAAIMTGDGALTHKKHVLVEKPAAPSEAEFITMVLAAKENGVFYLKLCVRLSHPVLQCKEIHRRHSTCTLCQNFILSVFFAL